MVLRGVNDVMLSCLCADGSGWLGDGQSDVLELKVVCLAPAESLAV